MRWNRGRRGDVSPTSAKSIRLEHSWTRSVVVLHLLRHFCMTTEIISREMSKYRRIGIFLVRLPPGCAGVGQIAGRSERKQQQICRPARPDNPTQGPPSYTKEPEPNELIVFKHLFSLRTLVNGPFEQFGTREMPFQPPEPKIFGATAALSVLASVKPERRFSSDVP